MGKLWNGNKAELWFVKDFMYSFQTNATCPQDRKSFEVVSVQECFGGTVVRSVSIKKEEKEDNFVPEENPTYCEVQ